MVSSALFSLQPGIDWITGLGPKDTMPLVLMGLSVWQIGVGWALFARC